MTDLVIFVGIVGLAAGGGILVGIIVAGRIDRILAPRPKGPLAVDGAEADDEPADGAASRKEHA